MLKAIIFDFNGIILNDEPVHFQAMRDAVAELGIRVSEQEYWDNYLPLDDKSCLRAICLKHGRELTEEETGDTLECKARLYRRRLRHRFPLFPGVAELIRTSAGQFPLAVASGARRDEIELTLTATGLIQYFQVLVGAQDFIQGKPHPESFLRALRLLNGKLNNGSPAIRPKECLVIEDSIGGIEGARAAGMFCLAVTNSYPAGRLVGANRIVDTLAGIGLEYLRGIIEGEL